MATFYLKEPTRETLPFRTELLSNPATMAYRIGQEGARIRIPLPAAFDFVQKNMIIGYRYGPMPYRSGTVRICFRTEFQ